MKTPVTTANEPRMSAHSRTAKVLAGLIVVCCSAALYVIGLSQQQPAHGPDTLRFVLENTGTGLLVAGGLCAFGLKQVQRSVYWLYWLKLDKRRPDERQAQVRQKVFEQSYGLMLFVALLFFGAVRAGGRISLIAAWVLGILAVSLPSVLAAWRRDS